MTITAVRPSDDAMAQLIEDIVIPEESGYTIRQFYYHLISNKYLIPNNLNNYKWLVKRLVVMRKSGVIHWATFVDRDRGTSGLPAEEPEDPEEEAEKVASWITDSIANPLHRWTNQPILVRVAIEKKALQGVFERECILRSVRLSPFKGSPSLSFLWEIGTEMVTDMELLNCDEGVILYYGDHDPTGMNIPEAAMNTLLHEMGWPSTISLKRCGLNQDQALDMNLPPDPAKLTDSRAVGYIDEYGHECWELDAVPPSVLREWVKGDIEDHFDTDVRAEVRADDRRRTKLYKARIIEAAREIIDAIDEESEDEE